MWCLQQYMVCGEGCGPLHGDGVWSNTAGMVRAEGDLLRADRPGGVRAE